MEDQAQKLREEVAEKEREEYGVDNDENEEEVQVSGPFSFPTPDSIVEALTQRMESDMRRQEEVVEKQRELNTPQNLSAAYRLWIATTNFTPGTVVVVKPGCGISNRTLNHGDHAVFVRYLDVGEQKHASSNADDLIHVREDLDCIIGLFLKDCFFEIMFNSKRLMKCQ